jgi:protein TonB
MPLARIHRLLRNALLCIGAALAASSCTVRRDARDESLPRPSAATAPDATQAEVSAAPAVPPPAPAPRILTLADYKVAVARLIEQNNPQHLFDGAPPPMLRSVVVLTIAVDEQGKLVRARVMRGNGHRALEQLAMDSVQRASPLPPPGALARRGLAEFNETWLFRADGRFQLRSTAEAQSDS